MLRSRSVKDSSLISPAQCDLRRLPIGASEAYLLSRIEGSVTLEDLAEMTAMPLAEARRMVQLLFELGAVVVDGERKGKSAAPPRSVGRYGGPGPSSRRKTVRPAPETSPKSVRSRRPAPKSEPPCDLDPALQKKLRELDARLPTLTDHGVLGVSLDATSKEIRRAYFDLAAAYHPDRFFGKSVGALGPVLQRIFTRATAAHERLLASAKRTARRSIAPEPARKIATTRPTGSGAPKSRRMVGPPSVPPKSKRTVAPPSAPPKSKRTVAPAPASKRKAQTAPPPSKRKKPQSRPSKPKLAPVPEPQQMSSEEYARATAEAFKKIETEKANAAARTRARVFVDMARAAEASGDVVTASQHYEIAQRVFDDPELSGSFQAAREAAAHELAVRRAREAERKGDWEKAVLLWNTAHGTRPSATTAERLSSALLRGGGDVRRAVTLAQEAALAEPNRVDIRVTLAEALFVAGLMKRARTELDRALERAPQDPRANELSAKIGKFL